MKVSTNLYLHILITCIPTVICVLGVSCEWEVCGDGGDMSCEVIGLLTVLS